MGRHRSAGVLLLAAFALRADDPAPPAPGPEDLQAAVAGLAHEDGEVRFRAFDRLLEWGIADPAPVLRALPESPDDAEVSAACGELRRKIPVERARRSALKAGGPSLAGEIAAFVDRPSAETFDALRTRSVAQGTWAEVSRACKAFLAHPDGKLRALILSGCLFTGDAASIPILEAFLADPDPSLRMASVTAYAQAGGKGSRARLLSMLEDAHPEVRMRSASTLLQAADEALFQEAADRLTHEDAGVREGVLFVLAQGRAYAFVPRIAPLLSDPDLRVRVNAVGAIGLLGGKAYTREIVGLLDDPLCAPAALQALRGFAQRRFAAGERGIAEARGWWEQHKGDPELAPPK